MRTLLIIIGILKLSAGNAQNDLPFYYEKNLPLYGKPDSIAEYYYEYHTQAKAHYYNHYLQYDQSGRINKHIKTNVGLLDLDKVPLPFHDIIDTRPVTITYTFYYDAFNRTERFVRHQFQEQVGVLQQDEEWKYDTYGMLYEHNFWEVSDIDTILKNPSAARIIYRDNAGQVTRIEKLSYSFSNKALVIAESADYLYKAGAIDSIITYRYTGGTKLLSEKKFNIVYEKYNPFNTDSILFRSYSRISQDGEVTEHLFSYDNLRRMTGAVTRSLAHDTLSVSEWTYDSYKTTERTDGYLLEVYYDETGYERYREEFMDGLSLAVPADLNTRIIQDGVIINGLLEVWDPVTLFYRKDTEYVYFYDQITGIRKNQRAFEPNSVYPNPSSGILFIQRPNGISGLELTDVNGKKVILETGQMLKLDVPQGIYLLTIIYSNGVSERIRILIE